MLLNSLTDPTKLQATDTGATTQPIAKPAPTTQPITTQPATQPVSAIPTAPTSPVPAPTTPPPLATPDPLAFAPAPTQPYTAPGGQQFVGGTQTTDPTSGQVTQNGVLGLQYVPGSNGGLVDLGGGNFAPTPGSDPTQGYSFGAPHEILTAGGANPTQDQSLMAGLYGTSGYDPSKAGFQAVYRGPTGDLIFAAPGFNPDQLPTGATLVSGQAPFQGAGPAAYGSAPSGTSASASGNLIPTNAPKLTMGGEPTAPSGMAPGAGNDVHPSTPGAGSVLPPDIGNASPGGSSFAPGVNLNPTTVDNALTNFTISPNNTVDRVKLAQDALHNTIQNVLDPAYQARERDLNRYNFGAGRGVSGEARTSQGDVASDYGRQVANLSNTLLNSATNGSIEDLYRNIGIAQQQQAFQAGQQGTAFNQSLQQLLAGSSGDPAQTALILASIFGGQGQNLGQALGNYTAAQTANNNTQIPSWLYPYIYGSPTPSQPQGGYVDDSGTNGNV